jgi:hypothetical protein
MGNELASGRARFEFRDTPLHGIALLHNSAVDSIRPIDHLYENGGAMGLGKHTG